MKVAILVGDGMSDYPIEELGKKTPLEVAKIPNINEMAKAYQQAAFLDRVPAT